MKQRLEDPASEAGATQKAFPEFFKFAHFGYYV